VALISRDAKNEEYEEKIREVLQKYKDEQGITSVVSGDIFLDEVKKYRENNLAKLSLKGLFPLWQQKSLVLARKFITLGFKSVITCVDSKQLDAKFCGREYDNAFLAELPAGVDPCGENGEFHTFAYAGPIFTKNLEITKGEIVARDGQFYFCDLLQI
jgi:uncharacterized protein (TIGR00290 family)